MTDPNRTPYITGHCQTGACEGATKKSPSGLIFPQCKGTYVFRLGATTKEIVCEHDCHQAFAMIRALMNEMPTPDGISPISLPPTVQETPTPSRVPIPTETAGSVALSPFAGHTSPVTPAAGQEPPSHLRPKLLDFSRRFPETPSGRAARGQLEENVRLQLVKAHKAGPELLATIGLQPKAVAASINPEKPPSQGAVYAVFKRWETQGWVELADKPFRLVKVTESGHRNLIF